MSKQLHWEEGQSLEQHHLQRFQKAVFDLIPAERKLSWTFPYGVIDSKLNAEKLKDGVVEFDRLRAVMPGSGVEVNFPEDAILPSLTLKFAKEQTRLGVFLVVPSWTPNQPNVVRDTDKASEIAVARYQSYSEPDCRDENTGFFPKAIHFRKINARLTVDPESMPGAESLEVLRVLLDRSKEPSMPMDDPIFAPPCLMTQGAPQLRRLLEGLNNDVHNARKNLGERIKGSHFDYDNVYPHQYENILRLRTLNRFCNRVTPLLRASAAGSGVSPFDIYIELCDIVGELSALQLDLDDHAVEAYEHADSYPTFHELVRRIGALLVGGEEEKPMFVEFRPDHAWVTADLVESHFQARHFYLCVISEEPPETVAGIVENSSWFKLAARSLIDGGILVSGLRLRRVTGVVPGLDRSGHRHYFLVERERSDPGLWEAVRSECRLSLLNIEPQGILGAAQFMLYMTLPPQRRQV